MRLLEDRRLPHTSDYLSDRCALKVALVLGIVSIMLIAGCSAAELGRSALKYAVGGKAADVASADATTPVSYGSPTATPTPARVSPAPKSAPMASGRPGIPARSMLIPSLEIASDVAEVSTTYDAGGNLIWQTVPFLIGHFSGSANPGQLGNAIFSGHLTSQHAGSVFKRLPEITIGAGVILTAGDSNYLYRVVDTKVVDPSDLGAL